MAPIDAQECPLCRARTDGITERTSCIGASEERLSHDTQLGGIVNVVAGLVRFSKRAASPSA